MVSCPQNTKRRSGSANTIRPTGITYPNGRAISYNYNAGNDDVLSRVSNVSDSFNTLVGYTYLGLATPVQVNYPQPGVTCDVTVSACAGTSSDSLPGLDQFGRVINNQWCGSAGAPTRSSTATTRSAIGPTGSTR